MIRFTVLLSVAFLIFVFSFEASSQTRKNVRFARGATSASFRGSVKGYAYRDYVFRAREGQRLAVMLDSRNASVEIIVRNPSGENMNGGGTTWNDEIASNGQYTVRVLLPRAAARRGAAASYTLTIEIE